MQNSRAVPADSSNPIARPNHVQVPPNLDAGEPIVLDEPTPDILAGVAIWREPSGSLICDCSQSWVRDRGGPLTHCPVLALPSKLVAGEFDVRVERMGKKKKDGRADQNKGPRPIAENRKARHRFEVLETMECGILLVGSEVKSLRNGKLSLDESYGRVKGAEVWLVGSDIPEYANANVWNHDPKRNRKLLLHKQQVRRFANKAHEKGLTLVPLKLYFNERGIAKLLLGLCRGKKLHDKRETLKKADVKRDLQRAMRGRR